MIGITLTTDQIRNAPAQVRQWIEHEVIAALWEVNDKATPDFMDVMYAAIRAGREPADALRAAKLQMLHSGTAYRMPKYWAPFVLYSRS